MKITHGIFWLIGLAFWLFCITIQLLVPVTFVLGFTESSGFFGMSAFFAFIGFLIMIFPGGLNSVPSIVWRFRRELPTRIIETRKHYALQIKLFGCWLYVDATPDAMTVCTCWNPELSAHNFLVSSRKDAERYLDKLSKEIKDGFKDSEPAPEVLVQSSLIKGERVKK